MHYDITVNASSLLLHDFAARLAFAPSPLPASGESWGTPLRAAHPLESLLVIMAFFPATSGAPRGGELPPVAYSLYTPTRLGHSPKGAFDRAYHNMTAKAESKTYFGLDKKTGPFTWLAFKPPYLDPRSPAMAAPSAAFGPSVASFRDQNNDFMAFLIS